MVPPPGAVLKRTPSPTTYATPVVVDNVDIPESEFWVTANVFDVSEFAANAVALNIKTVAITKAREIILFVNFLFIIYLS